MLYVEVRGESLGDLERALRQFSKQVKKAEIVNEVKRREFYVKLGEIGCSSFAANKRDAMANFKICSLG